MPVHISGYIGSTLLKLERNKNYGRKQNGRNANEEVNFEYGAADDFINADWCAL
jgi:hypothetical protein